MGGAVIDDPEDAAGGGVGLFSHHLPDEPIERCDPATGFGTAEVVRPTSAAAADVERGQIGECPSALVGVLDPLPARARSRRERVVDPSARLDRWLLVGADHELAWMQPLALEASLVEVEHRPCLLEEGGVGGEDPGAMLPGLERVLGQPAGDRRGRGLADAPLDDQPVQLSAREARERGALPARKLAGDRLHLRDLFRGENGGGDPNALDPRAPPTADRGSVVASERRPPAPSPAGGRSPRSSTPQSRTEPSSPAARPCAAACNRRPGARARPAPRWPRRFDKGSVPPSASSTTAVRTRCTPSRRSPPRRRASTSSARNRSGGPPTRATRSGGVSPRPASSISARSTTGSCRQFASRGRCSTPASSASS